ncbi:MAG: FG-GAP-like repeat-containing protein [Phycisphaerales bacterium]
MINHSFGGQTEDRLEILLNNASGAYFSAGSYPAGQTPDDIGIADLDNDGDLDIVSVDSDDREMSIRLNNGDATFGPRVTLEIGGDAWGLALGDLSGDGRVDAVVTSKLNERIVWVENICEETATDCPADLNGDGDLNFFDVSAFLIAYQSQNPLADFTGDGRCNFGDVSAFLTSYQAGCP